MENFVRQTDPLFLVDHCDDDRVLRVLRGKRALVSGQTGQRVRGVTVKGLTEKQERAYEEQLKEGRGGERGQAEDGGNAMWMQLCWGRQEQSHTEVCEGLLREGLAPEMREDWRALRCYERAKKGLPCGEGLCWQFRRGLGASWPQVREKRE